MSALDRRLTPANGRVAHVSLKGQVAAEYFVEGEAARVAVPLADLLARPDGPRDRQLLMGEAVRVLERRERHAFVQAARDGYCGWLDLAAVGPDHPVTHRIAAPATHLYATPSLKRREVASLSFGALLDVRAGKGRFAETADGLFVPRVHLAPAGTRMEDPAGVAETFLGTPYLWGGNSRAGIDCSGLVQAAMLACGLACPGDSDQQFRLVGRPLASGEAPGRNDLFFWKGHVALALDGERLIHANGAAMAVTIEPVAAALVRIAAEEGEAAFLGIRRPQ
ncbi:MAG: C40 family peptidase [Proteobacteria bacterium]|nr:C40 family peptidase [Pseudomonadota bacterium]MBS0571854.1 C40 family peptidase [Pseudomonadota bacterium]